MVDRQMRMRRGTVFAVLLVVTALVAPFAAGAEQPQPLAAGPPLDFQAELAGSRDQDDRSGAIAPSAAQRQAAAARGTDVRWNRFGTAATVTPAAATGRVLASALPGEPAEAARAWVADNRDLYRLSEAGVAALEVIAVNEIGDGHAVLFRQRFGDLPAAYDGLLTVGVLDGAAVHAAGSLVGDGNAPAAATLSAADAVLAAAEAAGRSVSDAQLDAAPGASTKTWTAFDIEGFTHPQRARLVALPTPEDGVRAAWEVFLLDNEADPLAVSSYVDARTGEVLVVEDRVDYLQEQPEELPEAPSQWSVFPVSPPLDYSSNDTRELWCWSPLDPNCDRIVADTASRVPWDTNARTGAATNTTLGNNARSVENWNSNNPFTVGVNPATPRPDRDYTYPWTNQWYEERCNPDVFTSPQRNDIDAALANLFAMHNQMHDWAYHLGFTEQNFNLQDFNFGDGGRENDPEQGNAQAGGVTGGPPQYAARDNANQITPADGTPPITNMYLWQPIPGGFYAPCVDGDYDMTVIGHEYTHAITNRMIAGPDAGYSGPQAGAMGESWSDYFAMEQLHEYALLPLADENPWAVGPYVTGNKQSGIRNYGMDDSPLNYSNIGYDITGPQVHADGEIWSATQFALREAFNDRYDRQFPSRDGDLQVRCAEGELDADECPGNRRWMQINFDSLLLMQSAVSMVDARDALLAADRMRFGGDNQDLIWDTMAARGLGADARSRTNADPDPTPSFRSPLSRHGTLVFRTTGPGARHVPAKLFAGRYEARSVPVADTDRATELDEEVSMVPGRYDFVVQAPGKGLQRLTATVRAGRRTTLTARLDDNVASAANGATASGEGTELRSLIDDTEGTNWTASGAPVAGRTVTVDLAGNRPQQVRRVHVSTHLRPRRTLPDGTPDPDDPSQSRFSALRRFAVDACTDRGRVDCTSNSDFNRVYLSPADAFPAVAPRPTAPDLIFDEFRLPNGTRATHLRLRVITNQCTGAPDYAGDQDDDPRHNTDCATGSAQSMIVRAAEFQAFAQR